MSSTSTIDAEHEHTWRYGYHRDGWACECGDRMTRVEMRQATRDRRVIPSPNNRSERVERQLTADEIIEHERQAEQRERLAADVRAITGTL